MAEPNDPYSQFRDTTFRIRSMASMGEGRRPPLILTALMLAIGLALGVLFLIILIPLLLLVLIVLLIRRAWRAISSPFKRDDSGRQNVRVIERQ